MQLARCGADVRLGGILELDLLEDMAKSRENKRYLPGVSFPPTLTANPDLEACLDGVRDVLVVVPSHGLRETLTKIKPLLREDSRVCWATKGFELHSGKLPHTVAEEVLGNGLSMAVLSGPTFAKEVAEGLPTAMTIAANDEQFAADLAKALSSNNFRAYTSDDMIGVEVGGAVKNVLAIAAGMTDGLGFGANTRVALITRGLVELMRLGTALGAKRETFMGLACMGDLVLTCTSGKTVEEAQQEIQQVVEGVLAAEAVKEVADELGIEMPICEQVYKILYEGTSPQEALQSLMTRQLKPENQ
jgi:glycerol-3-phosphate dehydrogenase (NAD(P)+)